jgi:glycosyltransferase involved in cell wall biosynthesis
MKIMLFCWAEEMKIELLNWAMHLALLPQDFIITPLVRLKDKMHYKGAISQLNQTNKNINVDPIYLKSHDSRFRNLLSLNILLSDFLSIFHIIKRSKPNVIVCFYVLHAYPLVVLKKIFRFSLCVVAMGSDVNLENDLLHKLVKKFIYRNCELVFACSWKLKERIERECDCNVIVVPSSADTSFFKPLNSKTTLRRKWSIKPRSRVIITVCRLDKNKGVDDLIKSLWMLNSDDVNLLIVGEGVEQKKLKELSFALGVQRNVTFLGFREREELLELYNLTDLFALASYSEGLPRALIEAMACGCIPIATNVGDVATVVVDDFNGFIVNPGDYEKFSERIKETLALSEEKIKLMQSRARSAVTADFDSRKLIKRMVHNINALFLSRSHEN